MKLQANKPLLIAGSVIAEGEVFSVLEQRGRELIIAGYAHLFPEEAVAIVTDKNDGAIRPLRSNRKKAVPNADT